MLRTMLDADTSIRVIRNRLPAFTNRFRDEAESSCISTIVLYELLHGAAKSNRPAYQRDLVEDFCTRLTVLDFDTVASDHAADIKLDLGKRGQLIGPNDLLIAGHARSLGFKLITGNLKEFTRVEGLRCEDWLQPPPA
jgi:tRNA(fMet)-specific endonuclease VapC